MTFDEYQKKALSTAVYPKNKGLEYCTIKFAGELGEFAEKYGKIIRDKAGVIDTKDRLLLGLELGDSLWYIANLAHLLGFNLNQIAQMNVDKLASRQARGKLQGSGDER